MKIYNTLSRSIEEINPVNPKEIGLYTCGPTVYNYAHIGNLRTFIFEDILKRVLLAEGYAVKHVMNITDVGHLTSDDDTGEDKMEKGAERENRSVYEIAEYYTESFRKDIRDLNILDPDVWPKATEHIGEQIELVRTLEKKGFTYRIDDGIYFDTSRFSKYGAMARLDKDGLQAGKRVELVAGKKNPTDFALWKFSPPDQKRLMEWESPWGKGFPGWHIECSAMSMAYLGESFDIHCGGVDHIQVHHTNEIAQSEAATGKKWVRYWVHGEFLVLESEKMAKSGDNFITLNVLRKKNFDPLAYRYFCLNAHYRAQLKFTWDAMESAARGFENFKRRVIELKKDAGDASMEDSLPHEELDAFMQAAGNDMNMPEALSFAWAILKTDAYPPKTRLAVLREMDRVLGFGIDALHEETVDLEEEIEKQIQQREEARKNKDFETADRIRDNLKSRGILLQDSPQGVKWVRA